MIFNGIEKGYLTVSHEFTIPAMSELEYDLYQLKKGGARTRKKRHKELYISVPVVIYTDDKDIDDIKVEINEWLVHNENKKLTFNFYPTYFYMAQVYSINWTDIRQGAMQGIIDFVCEQPYRLKEANPLEITATKQVYEIGGHLSTNWESETVFSVPQSSYTLECDDEKIILEYNFIAGDTLRINQHTRDVALNGKDLAVSIQPQSTWFELPKGTANLKATESTQIKYNERYY